MRGRGRRKAEDNMESGCGEGHERAWIEERQEHEKWRTAARGAAS